MSKYELESLKRYLYFITIWFDLFMLFWWHFFKKFTTYFAISQSNDFHAFYMKKKKMGTQPKRVGCLKKGKLTGFRLFMLAFEADFVISFLLDWLFWEIFFVRFFPLPLLDFFESFDNSITNSATEINYVFIHRTVGNSENPEGQVEIQGILKGEGFAFIPVKKLTWHGTPHGPPCSDGPDSPTNIRKLNVLYVLFLNTKSYALATFHSLRPWLS